MTTFIADPLFDHARAQGTAVLLVNLGTPDAPTTSAVRRYLAEFLSDPRVIELPAPLRWLLLHCIVLRFRPARSAHAYAQVWDDDGSPLLSISLKQAHALELRLADKGFAVPVRVAMRYGNPSIKDVLAQFRGQGLRRLLVLPMYPQYSGSTTGSVWDALGLELSQWRWVPELRFINSFYDDGGYIDALAASVLAHWDTNGGPGDRLLMSFHGLPQRYLMAGDPYFCHCQMTARLLSERLGLDAGHWQVSFQSRVGREQWLTPYTDATFEQLGRAGVGKLDVICPGFSADCLETREEIAITGREQFVGAGGQQFSYIPALNDNAAHINALANIVLQRSQDWLGSSDHAAETGASAERASIAREKFLQTK